MTHPLTDDLAEDIAPNAQWAGDIGDTVFRHNDMRAAADWQLEQVIKFMKEHEKMFGGSGMIFILEDAMRPQVVDLPQANSDVCGEEGMERARQRTFEENDELMRLLSDS